MTSNDLTGGRKKATRKVFLEERPSYLKARLAEPSTWLGLLALGASVATGGLADWLNPTSAAAISSAMGLIFCKEA